MIALVCLLCVVCAVNLAASVLVLRSWLLGRRIQAVLRGQALASSTWAADAAVRVAPTPGCPCPNCVARRSKVAQP